jgi:hypothetical protein
LGDGDHNDDGDDNDGDGNNRQLGPPDAPPRRCRRRDRPYEILSGWRLVGCCFFPGIGAASPPTRAIILITLSYIALLPSHEIKNSSSLIEAVATIRWRSSSDKEYRQSLPPIAKNVEGGRPLVVRYLTVQFVDRAHPADDAASAHKPPDQLLLSPAP